MCGIAGIFGFNENPNENIKAMNGTLLNRGPDSGNYIVDDKENIVMGHRRLSVIDLSEAGGQPMYSHSERYIITYNGEIYNASEIKDELEKSGRKISWRGHSDTEILLEAIECWGIDKALEKAKGMWAIAAFDRESKKLFLSRDRMGEKPLYYGMVNGSFVYASTVNAIMAIKGFSAKINRSVMGVFFNVGYIPAPYTIYEGIYKLEPGTILETAPPFKEWNTHKYYDISQVALQGQNNLFKGSFSEAVEELERKIATALKGQMLSDVPLGAFLSGGIDSTLVVSLMQSISDKKIKTFTIGFEEEKYNEAVFAKELAAHLGTDHHESYVGYRDVMDLLPKLPEIFGEPFADSSQLPTLLVSRMTREHVTVALSGDGGDEFFCGYNTYREAAKSISIMQNKLSFIKNPLRKNIGELLLKPPMPSISVFNKTGRCFTINSAEDFYRMVLDDNVNVRKLCAGLHNIETKVSTYKDGYLKVPESNLMLMDMLQYLPDDILTKVDRSGMYYSLETRIPLLDRDVMEFAWSLPHDYKFNQGITKRALREILYRYVPKEMIERPKKGFSVPVSRWLLKGEMREWADSLMWGNNSITSELIDMKFARKLWTDYTNGGEWNSLIWFILMFEQWCEYAV